MTLTRIHPKVKFHLISFLVNADFAMEEEKLDMPVIGKKGSFDQDLYLR